MPAETETVWLDADLARRLLLPKSSVTIAGFPLGRGRVGDVAIERFDLRAAHLASSVGTAKSQVAERVYLREHATGRVIGRPDIRIGLSFDRNGGRLRGFVSAPDGFYALEPQDGAKRNGSHVAQTLRRIDRFFHGDTPPADHLGDLLSQAKAGGRIRAVLGLRLPFTPVGHMGLRDVEDQQFAISAVQGWVLEQTKVAAGTSPVRFTNVPHLVLELDAGALQQVADLPEVAHVQRDTVSYLSMQTATSRIQAPQAATAGFTGAGQVVAVIDTGVLREHAVFGLNNFAGKIVHEACFSEGNCPGPNPNESIGPGSGANCTQYGTFAISRCSHGTHVASLAVANTTLTNPASFGAARGAAMMSIKVLNAASDSISGGNVVKAIDEVVNQAGAFSIASINISSGTNTTFSSQASCDALSQAHVTSVANAVSLGIAVVAASGNDGVKTGIDHPACMTQVISVGMSYKDTDSFRPGESNAAPFLDLLAPGHQNSVTSDAATLCNARLVCAAVPQSGPGGFATGFGTSQAAPLVSGAFAVLRQKNPTASIDTMLAALKDSGVPVQDGPLGATYPIPRIQIKDALDRIPLPTQATLTVEKTDFGMVTSSPAGINCGDVIGQLTCSASFAIGQQVTLTTTATHGPFTGWSGDADCSDGVVLMTSNKTCIANFDSARITLSVLRSGTGSGRVTSSPAGIDCGSQCSAMFDLFQNVTLTATADAGSTFTRWEGDARCSETPVSSSMDLQCTAVFTADAVTLPPGPLAQLFDFEGPAYTGSTAGMDLNGQNGFINPNTASSASARVFAMTGHSLQLATNPQGGGQFAGGSGPAGGFFIRSQTPVSFASGAPSECANDAACVLGDICSDGRCVHPEGWQFCFDVAVSSLGTKPAPPVIGSVSLLDGSNNALIAKANWVDRTATSSWNAVYDFYDAAGAATTGICGTGQPAETWWRWCTTLDLGSNRVLGCSLVALDGGTVKGSSFVDRFLFGGDITRSVPDALRIFVGGDSTIAGNTLGADNIRLMGSAVFSNGFE